MKNPTILKDELRILNADKSAVVTELRKASEDLKNIQAGIMEAEAELKEVRYNILEETARLSEIQGRAVSVRKELSTAVQENKNINNSLDASKVKNSQETKLHLGRIKSLKDSEAETESRIAELKRLYDRNANEYSANESERKVKLRELNAEIQVKERNLKVLSSELQKIEEEEKRQTKERLRREDKIREREKIVAQRETNADKREEDITQAIFDVHVVYGRLKELYAKEHPEVDLDKLITQV